MTVREAYARARVAWWLSNWREVWPRYSTGQPLPPLRFRNGLVLLHEPLDDPMSLFWEIFSNQYYRAPRRELSRGTIIDVGANIGAATLYWAWRAPASVIHAYEPNPSTFDRLAANVERNGLQARVRLFREAVFASAGTLPLWTGPNSMQATTQQPGAAAAGVRIDVPAVSLETVINRAPGGDVSLLKIDAEGAEVGMLEGTSAAAFEKVRRIVVEYHNFLVPDALPRCRAALDRIGFRCDVRQIRPGPEGYGLIRGRRRPHGRA